MTVPDPVASMRGGMRMPPNQSTQGALRFNEGRHAHAAESCLQGKRVAPRASMRGGMRMPPNHHVHQVSTKVSTASMRGGMRMPPNSSWRYSKRYTSALQ